MENAKQYIKTTRTSLIAATQGLSEAQWNFKPSPGQWSAAEILEHIVMTQEIVLGPICQRLADAPPAPAGHDPQAIDTLILAAFPDRTFKFKGPEVLQPTGRCTPSDAFQRLDANCARFHQYLDSTPGLRQHAVESRPLKAMSQGTYEFMDGYQWALAIAAHTHRHTLQILEVKADPKFPASESRASVA